MMIAASNVLCGNSKRCYQREGIRLAVYVLLCVWPIIGLFEWVKNKFIIRSISRATCRLHLVECETRSEGAREGQIEEEIN